MATLYVENVPTELYAALRAQAREHRASIAAEVLALLEENVPTADDLKRRRKFFEKMRRARPRRTPATFPSAEEMLRQDRQR
jgi:plasmid stability protein